MTAHSVEYIFINVRRKGIISKYLLGDRRSEASHFCQSLYFNSICSLDSESSPWRQKRPRFLLNSSDSAHSLWIEFEWCLIQAWLCCIRPLTSFIQPSVSVFGSWRRFHAVELKGITTLVKSCQIQLQAVGSVGAQASLGWLVWSTEAVPWDTWPRPSCGVPSAPSMLWHINTDWRCSPVSGLHPLFSAPPWCLLEPA